MIDTHNIKIIDDFIKKEFGMKLARTSFFELNDGSYEIFNKFLIKKESNRYLVETSCINKYFNLLKSAVTWCILDQRNKLGEMLILEELDVRLSGIDFSMQQHLRLFKKAKSLEDKLLYLDKLSEDKMKKQSIINELNKFINDSKEWQLQKFGKPKY